MKEAYGKFLSRFALIQNCDTIFVMFDFIKMVVHQIFCFYTTLLKIPFYREQFQCCGIKKQFGFALLIYTVALIMQDLKSVPCWVVLPDDMLCEGGDLI